MLKSTLLLAALASACAQDQSSSAIAHEGIDAGPPPCDAADAAVSPTCDVKGETVFLDLEPANLDHSDGKVTFCHATSSPTNPFVLITTSVNACFAHEMHEHLEQGGQLDVFPSGGCAD